MEWMLLPLKRYADFSGRSRRMEYWMFTLFNVLVVAGLAIVLGAIGYATGSFQGSTPPVFFMIVLGIVALGYMAVFLVPSIAVVVRRLHDRDMSGWWYLGIIVASMIPIVGTLASIALLVLMVLPGTPGPNRFGPDPKDPANAAVFA
ncbi:DUF805 domain-containing protein [Caenibius sp. WL]|uniref:DUF805 domain-containing protein n=1 Tax=Caenibius sp. WL TaxID=2872646 RepID=UPI001C991D7F|nr:DUF805 domain-containing protein [Caenibius sp. WL]QZP07814.1 DUF805 domain-containing protein [Caenibius sp. WL]